MGLVAAMMVNSGMRSAPAIDAVPPGEPEHALAIKGCSVQVGVAPLFGNSLSTRVTGSSRPSLPRIAQCNATFVKGLILFAVLAIMYAIGKRLGLLDEKPDSKDRDRPDCDPKNPSS